MNKNEDIVKTILTIIATAAIVFVVTSAYYLNNVSGKTNMEYVYDGNFTKLRNVLDFVNENFLYDNYTMKDLEDGAIHGMLEALNDPYTSYFDIEETKEFLEESKSDYVGVGIYITYGKEYELPMVIGVFKDSSALEAGVKPGDYIYAVGDEILKNDTTLEEVSNKLLGPLGTNAKVTFVRIDEDGNQTKYTAMLERRNIVIKPFEYEVIDDNIGYMKFMSFDSGEDLKFISAYNELTKEKNVKGLIIDLRDNPRWLV